LVEKLEHVFIPEHIKLTEEEKKDVLQQHSVTIHDLPLISIKDPSIAHLEAAEGDLIKIVRNSKTAGTVVFYRSVTNE
jgi:DNA-directed RNA polymerase subunit H (RpoH/RPB5)